MDEEDIADLIEEIANEIAQEYTDAGASEIAAWAGNPGQEVYFNENLVPTFFDIAPDMMMQLDNEPPDYAAYDAEMSGSCPDDHAAEGASLTIGMAFEYIMEAWELINEIRQMGDLVLG